MSKLKIKPLGDRVILEAIKEDKTTASGIVLPETAEKEKPEKGIVVAIGQGKSLENGQRTKISVKVGDKVVFKKYSPDEIKIDKKEYLIISEDDILAIID